MRINIYIDMVVIFYLLYLFELLYRSNTMGKKNKFKLENINRKIVRERGFIG